MHIVITAFSYIYIYLSINNISMKLFSVQLTYRTEIVLSDKITQQLTQEIKAFIKNIRSLLLDTRVYYNASWRNIM